jgi:hypothetical protein
MNQKISPRPSLPKRGIIPPFGKGRLGGILKINVLTILRLFISNRSMGLLSYVPIDCPRMARLEELTELDVWEK